LHDCILIGGLFLPPTGKMSEKLSFLLCIKGVSGFVYFSNCIYLPVPILEAKLHIIFKKSQKIISKQQPH
jgi:hypothetical protein